MTGLLIAGVALLVALGFGLYRMRTDGRFKQTAAPAAGMPSSDADQPDLRQESAANHSDTQPGQPSKLTQLTQLTELTQLGERATFIQFSSAFCAPCRATKVILGDVARTTEGVVHIEVDAESHLELVRELKILRTPTTLILGRDGTEIARAAGAPTKQQVLDALPDPA